MLSSSDLWLSTAATVVLWIFSGTLSLLLGWALAAGSLSSNSLLRRAAHLCINVSRGVPTSILVIAAGIGMMHVPSAPHLPIMFPGSLIGFEHLYFAIALALAVGSSGHLAMTFRAAILALGHCRPEQAAVLGMSLFARTALLARESAAVALPPTGARLVHHLHNTAFASLFPVVELFSYIQGQSNATFRVLDFALLGCAIYVTLSSLTWVLVCVLEAALAPPASRPRQRMVIKWS